MGFIGRSTLPQNFLDSTSDGMRLPQPNPQFFFAMLALGAIQRTAAIAMSVDGAESFVKIMFAGGGAPVPANLERFARTADAYPDAIQYVSGFGKNAGDTVTMRRPVYTGGGYSEAARRVNPAKPTSLTGQALSMEDVEVTLGQFEGPYDATNSEVRPYMILEFDTKYRKNKDNLAQETANHLTFDYVKWLDTVVRDRFRATANMTYADAVANVLSMTVGAGHSINLDLILQARKAISDRERRPFDNGRYLCLVPTIFNTDMIQDPIYRQLAAQQNGKGNQLFNYLASVQDVDIFEVSTLKSYAAGDTVPNDGQVVPAGSTVYEGLLIGPNAVGFGRAEDPTAHDTADTDFGKNAKVIWRSVEAFQTLDSRGIQRILFQAA
jgi:hypothetical protein